MPILVENNKVRGARVYFSNLPKLSILISDSEWEIISSTIKRDDVQEIEIDLEDIVYADSKVLGVLLNALRDAKKLDKTIIFDNCGVELLQVFLTQNLINVFEIQELKIIENMSKGIKIKAPSGEKKVTIFFPEETKIITKELLTSISMLLDSYIKKPEIKIEVIILDFSGIEKMLEKEGGEEILNEVIDEMLLKAKVFLHEGKKFSVINPPNVFLKKLDSKQKKLLLI